MARASKRIDVKDWTYDRFLCFLLLYASYADYEFSDKQREQILTHVDHTVLDEVESVYNNLGEYEQLDMILTLKKKYISSSQDKSQLLALLKKQFNSDGDYSKLESVLYQFLDKLL